MNAGVVVWFTGLPSSGKSTFAERAFEALRQRGRAACLLDGDSVRASLVPPPDYSPAGRADFYETLGRLAALLAAQGLVVLVPATAHRRAFRTRARERAPAFLEVWIDTPKEECERRDTKGLYAKSRLGAAEFVPGATEPYEPPERPAVVAHGGDDSTALETLWAELARLGAL
jgi:adenylylsulfate kinase